MKILQVMAGAKHGGAETAFVDMCIAFAQDGQEIEVVTRPNDIRVPRLKQAGLKVHELPFGGAIDIYTRLAMKRIIRKFKPDIVQTWMSRAPQKTPKWTKSMGIPRYLVVPRLGGYYKLKYFKSADYFNTITPDIRIYLIKNGVGADKVFHINNFAETESVDVPINRVDMDTPQDAPLLLGLGRLHTSKAFDTLIKVVSKMPKVHLWIAGEGPDRDVLEALISKLGVADRIKLLGWRNDRAALLQAVDVCVFSSRYEPFGTVFVQAWAQKTPLVTTDADGPRQFVRDGEDGLVVKIDDHAAMMAAIETVINDQKLAVKIVENGYKRYSEEFTKEKTLSSYLSYYKEIRATEGL